MQIFDASAALAALRFPLARPGLVLAGSAVYALPFAVQSVLTARAGQDAPGAAGGALLAGLLAFAVFAVVASVWTRAALTGLGAPPPAEPATRPAGRLLMVALLVVILLFTVMGTGFIAVFFLLGAVAVVAAARAGMTDQPEGFVDIFALFGTGEWIVAGLVMLAYALGSGWFLTRLALAVPATVGSGEIKVLSAWPLSHKRAFLILFTGLAAALPGLVALWAVDAASAAALGAGPGAAHALPAGAGLVAFAAVSAIWGALKAGLVGAPLLALLAALHQRFLAEYAAKKDEK